MLLAGMTSTVFAQSDDFTTWTKFKVNYKIDPRFSLLSNLEFRTKDDVSRMDRLGLAIGGEYRAYSFLKLEAGYETHFRNLGDSEWKFRHRYKLWSNCKFSISVVENCFERKVSAKLLTVEIQKLAFVPA